MKHLPAYGTNTSVFWLVGLGEGDRKEGGEGLYLGLGAAFFFFLVCKMRITPAPAAFWFHRGRVSSWDTVGMKNRNKQTKTDRSHYNICYGSIVWKWLLRASTRLWNKGHTQNEKRAKGIVLLGIKMNSNDSGDYFLTEYSNPSIIQDWQ